MATIFLLRYSLNFLKTSYLDSHTTNDVKLEMLSGVLTGNRILHDEYNVCGIAHARAYRKDDIFMQRELVQSFKCRRKWGKGLKAQSFVQKVPPFNNFNIDKTFPPEAYSCL